MSWRFNLSTSPGTEASFDENLFDLEVLGNRENKGQRGSLPSYKTASVPLAPTNVDDIFSQFSQKDISSTQAFSDNCKRFGSTSRKRDVQSDILGINPWTSSYDGTNVRNNTPLFDGRHESLFHTPPQLELEKEEYLYPEDSPEFFPITPRQSRAGENESFAIVHSQNQLGAKDNEMASRTTKHTPAQRLDNFVDSTPNPLLIPAPTPSHADKRGMLKLRSTSEIPGKYRSVFSQFPYFNIVQSRVLDEVFYTDRPLVVCAPTGSGKTVIFELAIIRLLMTSGGDMSNTKIVYMAPMKALCSERSTDWESKFGALGLKCREVTGDSELDDYFEIRDINIIMTTPEKWDSMTRKWKDNKSLVESVRLFLIDEVHLLNDEDRGATVEAVISRMKTVQTSITRHANKPQFKASMRLIAISATIPNVEDIAAWIGGLEHPASSYSMDDTYRPVKLRKVVLGFPMSSNMSAFKFDLSLSYKISGIVHTYSEHKPTLVFCSTRKSTQQAASILIKDARFIINSQHRQRLQRIADSLHDSKLRELVVCGVGYHHAGLDPTDRKNVESMFVKGELPVLFSTSTLAVGVNLPAHLVIIKSTQCYAKGVYVEYSETQVLQMIGRAGRPQFDTSATAVILTTTSKKNKYSALLQGTQNIESSLHRHLIEHLNAEIVLHTITDVSVALEWLKSTFLFIRIQKNPTYYGIPEGLKKEALEQKLQDMCIKNLNTLERSNLVKMDDGFDLKPTEPGCLMARYYIAFDSIKEFLGIQGSESLSDMVTLISKCKEFSDVKLRVNEKRILNTLNKDKHKATIRFPVSGKIKTTDQKINCLIQATLGCLPISEFSLNQDVTKIFRSGQRVTRCLMELLMLKTDFNALQNSILVAKCMKARLWENSHYVSKQIEKVGTTLSTMMVNAGLTTFKKIEETNPREIELIVNRHPPFGSQIRDAVLSLPKYEVSIEQKGSYTPYRAEIIVTITMTNYNKRRDSSAAESRRGHHFCVLLVGDADNKVVSKQRIGDSIFMREGVWSRRIDIRRASKAPELSINVISQDYVGLDVNSTYTPYYSGSYFPTPRAPAPKAKETQSGPGSSSETKGTGKSCNHRCLNKDVCGHDCCKHGVGSKTKADQRKKATEKKGPTTPAPLPVKKKNEANKMESFLHQLHERAYSIPGTPSRLKVPTSSRPAPKTAADMFESMSSNLQERFSYNRTPRLPQEDRGQQKTRVETPRIGDQWEEIELHQHNQENVVEAGFGDDDLLFEEYNIEDDDFDDLPSLYDCGLSSCRPEPQGRESSPSADKATNNKEDFSRDLDVSRYFSNKSSKQNIEDMSADGSSQSPVSKGMENNYVTTHKAPLMNHLPPYKRPATMSLFQKSKQLRKEGHLPPPPPTPGWDDFEMADQPNARRQFSETALNTKSSSRRDVSGMTGHLPLPSPTPGWDDFEMADQPNARRQFSETALNTKSSSRRDISGMTGHLPPSPPTPGWDDFEMSEQPNARRQFSETALNSKSSSRRDVSGMAGHLTPPPPTPGWDDFEMPNQPNARRPFSGTARRTKISSRGDFSGHLSLPPSTFRWNDHGTAGDQASVRSSFPVAPRHAEKAPFKAVPTSRSSLPVGGSLPLLVDLTGLDTSCGASKGEFRNSSKPRVPSFFSSALHPRMEQEDHDAFSSIFHGVF